MHLLTRSQLDHFQSNANSLKLKATRVKQTSLKEYLLSFLQPLQVNLEANKLKIEVFDKIGNVDNACTDFAIYEDVLY